jgi:hypothetical protein
MDIRFLLEEHNKSLLSALSTNGQTTARRPILLVAFLMWLFVYLVSLCSSIGVGLAVAFSILPRFKYSKRIFCQPENDHWHEQWRGRSAPIRNDRKDKTFYTKGATRKVSKSGELPYTARRIPSGLSHFVERTYFILSRDCAQEVIITDLQLFFKERVLVTPAREDVRIFIKDLVEHQS